MKNERAAIWARVSSGSQTEETQLRELGKHADRQGYQVVKTIRLHDISASKGEQEKAMAEVIADIQAGLYEVLLIDDSSRIDRRDNVHARDYFRAMVGLAGGRIESRTEPLFGKVDIGGQVMTIIAADQNAQYTKKLREQTDRAIRQIIANNSFHGKQPWGWISQGERYQRRLICDRPDEIRQMYEMASAGKSCADIGREFGLYSETVDSIIRNEVNKGHRRCSHTFLDGTSVEWVHLTGAVVSDDQWLVANHQLDLNKASPSPSGRKPKHWISGALSCGECGGVMHAKVQVKGDRTYSYLRCGGLRATANAKGCGNTHLLSDAIEAVAHALQDQPVQVKERRVRPGNKLILAAERRKLEETRLALDQMPQAVKVVALSALEEEVARLDSTPIIEDEEVLVTVGTLDELWRTGDKRRLLDELDLMITKDRRVVLEESYPWGYPGHLVFKSGLVLDFTPPEPADEI